MQASHSGNAIKISIHALRDEGDQLPAQHSAYNTAFLSTPSAMRATRRKLPHKGGTDISIHALRDEGDC